MDVKAIVSQMTLEEKVALCSGKNFLAPANAGAPRHRAGHGFGRPVRNPQAGRRGGSSRSERQRAGDELSDRIVHGVLV